MKLPPLSVLLQYCLPHQCLSHIVGALSRCKIIWFKQLFIKMFCRRYQVDLSEAAYTQPEDYQSFHDFFTRALALDARSFEYGSQHILSPVDGWVSQSHCIEQGSLLQAKQHYYTVNALLGNTEQGEQFNRGYGLTFYLAPRDYHRVHMPLAGRLLQTQYIPGRLFSVNPTTAEHIPGLFTRNERLVCLFETNHGPMAMVLVGAMIVGNIHTSWSGLVNPGCQTKQTITTNYDNDTIELRQGEQMGYFAMGSTVITLFSQSDGQPLTMDTQAQHSVQLGQYLGRYEA